MMTVLNDFLQPIDSPITYSGAVSSYEFQYKTDRGAVTNSQLGNFSFGKGVGGTIVLGGSGNGSGQLIVNDSSGSTRVQINNTGIYVTDGSLTFLNSTGGTVLDSSGLVSLTSFSAASLQGSGEGTITGTAYTDVSPMAMTVVPLRNQKILLFACVTGKNDDKGNGYFAQARVFQTNPVGGTYEAGNAMYISGRYYENTPGYASAATQEIFQVEAGTNVFKLQARTSNAAATTMVDLGNTIMGYVLLGV